MGASAEPVSLHAAAASLCVFTAWITLPVAEAVDCQCTHFRCRSDLGEFVFAPTEMLSLEAQWCVRNDTAFLLRGECRYCASGCENNVCECNKSVECDWLSVASAVVCFAVAVVLLALSA